jgi:hypothetical protein
MSDYEGDKIERVLHTCDAVGDFCLKALSRKDLDVPAFVNGLIEWACWTYVDRIGDGKDAQDYIINHVQEHFLNEEVLKEIEAECDKDGEEGEEGRAP